ncbi:MAG: ABC transporter permease, partial [Stellaceae bacterium]
MAAAMRERRAILPDVPAPRDPWRRRALDTARRDLAGAFRSLRHAPAFAGVVILTLALGIGANTAVFSVFSATLLRPLAVPAPNQLSQLYWRTTRFPRNRHIDISGTNAGLNPSSGYHGLSGGADLDDGYSISYPLFLAVRDAAAARGWPMFGFAPLNQPDTLVVAGRGVSANATLVTDGYFSALGLTAARGRFFTADDFNPGAPLTAVISDAFWAGHLSRSTAAIGTWVTIDSHRAIVIGIAPAGFAGLENGAPDAVWLPARRVDGIMPYGGDPRNKISPYADDHYWWIQTAVRRPAGISPRQLQAALAPVFQASVNALLPPPLAAGEQLPQLRDISGALGINDLAANYGGSLQLLLVGVTLLLLLACVNTSALLFARSAARRSELATRLALGASRRHLVQQLL